MDFNINKINKKIVLYLSLTGFVLSFISGLLSGNRFSSLFIRSVVSGIVVGGVIIIVNIVIMLYLPELLETEEDEDSDSDSHIDIVIPEEDYEVQTNDSDYSDDDSSSGDSSSGDNTNTSFKEVDLDNLNNLTSLNDNYKNDVESYSDDSGSFSQSSSKGGDSSIMEEHTIEDMTKAVKTVLKKD